MITSRLPCPADGDVSGTTCVADPPAPRGATRTGRVPSNIRLELLSSERTLVADPEPPADPRRPSRRPRSGAGRGRSFLVPCVAWCVPLAAFAGPLRRAQSPSAYVFCVAVRGFWVNFVFSGAHKERYRNYFVAVSAKMTSGGYFTAPNVSGKALAAAFVVFSLTSTRCPMA
jgi:hypothetical protein